MPEGELVDPAADHSEQGRQYDDSTQTREHGHRDAGVGERAEEVEREDQQRCQRQADSQRGEDHCSPGCPHRHPNGVRDITAGAQLLAVARHNEQRVVDRQAEAHRGHHVQREDGHRRQRRNRRQREERTDDGNASDRERHQRRHAAPEDQQQQHQGRGQRDRLGAGKVLADLVVHLVVRLRDAAHAQGQRSVAAGVFRPQRGDAFRHRVIAAGDAREDECLGAVGVPQPVVGVEGPVGHDLGDPRLGSQPRGQRAPGLHDLGPVDADWRPGDEHEVRDALPERVAQHIGGLLGLDVGVGKTTAGKVAGNLAADGTRQQDEPDRGEEDQAPAADQQGSKTVEHDAPPDRRRNGEPS